METIHTLNSTFYIDEIARKLSQKYDVKSYVGPFNVFSAFDNSSEIEGVMGKFMFLSRMCGQFVGVDFDTYNRKFPDEQWFDSLDKDLVSYEGDLTYYIYNAEYQTGSKLVRIEALDKTLGCKNIYFPAEKLIIMMLKGTGFVDAEKFQELQNIRTKVF
ncbi:MAG: hypothetical protein KKA06_00275 [Nanoarchaeota archaeon]|nr:hypothetical protein [Nanoarchaeota archaeon]